MVNKAANANDRYSNFLFVDRNNVAAILIGLPYLPSGEKGVQYGKTKNFINEISDLTNTPIITIDERYSTIEAKKKILV